MPRSTALTGTLRHIPSLKEKLLSQAKTEQCRAHGLMLPPDWSKQGVFEMRSSGPGDVVFFHRYNETARPWPLALRLRKSDGELVDLAELTIEHNFYEDSAEVKSDQCLESFRVANLGTFDDMAPDSKRRRLGANLAIEDGGDPDGAQQLCLPAPATSPPSSGGSVRSGSLSGSRLMLPSTPRPSSRMLGGGCTSSAGAASSARGATASEAGSSTARPPRSSAARSSQDGLPEEARPGDRTAIADAGRNGAAQEDPEEPLSGDALQDFLAPEEEEGDE